MAVATYLLAWAERRGGPLTERAGRPWPSALPG